MHQGKSNYPSLTYDRRVRRMATQKNEKPVITSVYVKPGYGNAEKEFEIRYTDVKVIGNGSFGVVYMAKLADTSDIIAIKRVEQDRRFKNRELQLMRRLEHPNIVRLLFYFNTTEDKQDFLNLVLEFVPKTLHQVIGGYRKNKQSLPLFHVKLYMFQLFRALSYMHCFGICHRDIKPHNLLIDSDKNVLRVCDFGSAKILQMNEPNVSYICSRYYRPPELIFGATSYTTRVDVWSAATVLAECYLNKPFFPGNSSVDQMVEIIKVLGTPTMEEVLAMNPNYKDAPLASIKGIDWTRIFRARAPQTAIDLMQALLRYEPMSRLSAIETLAHPYFDELRKPETEVTPDGGEMPKIFDWLEKEVTIRPDLNRKIFPRNRRDSSSSDSDQRED